MKIEVQPYACNVCKIQRSQDTNSWYVLRTVAADVGIPGEIHIAHWSDLDAMSSGAAHACGLDHASRLFQRWAATGEFSE